MNKIKDFFATIGGFMVYCVVWLYTQLFGTPGGKG